jgi:hypothetical protein
MSDSLCQELCFGYERNHLLCSRALAAPPAKVPTGAASKTELQAHKLFQRPLRAGICGLSLSESESAAAS